ncbi:unnamed protein product [Rotaria magnacalcarata]|uniref:Envelope protein n=1 Tax=Rotaria magnacalcarata TaxID=392030 RepID=A0A816P057_9BILA|nr:unnamed protein product [Rotaria magnacalcarata]CAF4088617.1 unnamed protein product [Rotaria magnacalcarata]
MNLKNSILVLLTLFDCSLSRDIKSRFLETVKNSTLLHHRQTNTAWEYLGTYAQTESTINFILEIPVFQFMCDVFPASMAFSMQACMQYRTRVLENGSARRLNELFEAHVGRRERRQLVQAALITSSLHGGYKIIGDLFRGSNDEIVHRLDECENFHKHQEKLDDVLTTSILSLEDSNLLMLKSFKSLFDSANTTRSLIHSLMKMSLREQNVFTGWAKFSLKSEMRRHYEQMISAFSRVSNHDLNLEMFSPEQRTFVHDFLWNRVRSKLPVNFSASLAQFVPNLLVQQIISFTQVNESEISYELKEDDFNFVIETEVDDTLAKNETIDLDSILPKIVGHIRIENFFGIPLNLSNRKADLYKITRLPLFVDERKAVYTANLPRFLSLSRDGSSSEWFDYNERKCTVDEKSQYTFCAIPVPVFSSIQNPCLRSIVLNNSTRDCLKETVDLPSPQIVKFEHNIHAISVHTSLQCFEKGDKENKNIFSNITKVAIIKTRCNSFVSCGVLDFSSLGNVCEKTGNYLFTFNHTYDNPFILEKSVNPVDVESDNLKQVMDIASLIESALSHKTHLENAHADFQSHIIHTISIRTWPKIFIGFFIVISIVTILTAVFVFQGFLKSCGCFVKWQKNIECLFHLCFKKKKNQMDDSTLDIYVRISPRAEKESCYDNTYQKTINSNQLHPLLNTVLFNDRTVNKLNSLPEVIHEKPNPLPRKVYDYAQDAIEITSNDLSINSGEFFEEDCESEK